MRGRPPACPGDEQVSIQDRIDSRPWRTNGASNRSSSGSRDSPLQVPTSSGSKVGFKSNSHSPSRLGGAGLSLRKLCKSEEPKKHASDDGINSPRRAGSKTRNHSFPAALGATPGSTMEQTPTHSGRLHLSDRSTSARSPLLVETGEPAPRLLKSVSSLSKGSNHHPGLLRRSASAASAISSMTEHSSTSAPCGVDISGLRKKSSVKVIENPAHEVYEFLDKFGQGGYGEVWGCIRRNTGEAVAIKRIPVAQRAEELAKLERELKVFERLSNPYIVTLHEVFFDQEYLYLVMDLCTGGDLAVYMDTYVDDPDRIMRKLDFPDHVRGLPTATVGRLLWQMLAGIAYMHHHRFCHRDIKLQNYMIKDLGAKPQLQLVDFGMATRFKKGESITGTMGTIKYMAPEVLSGTYNEKCDIWAIGVVCFILCTEESPWGGKKSNEEMYICIKQDIRTRFPSVDKPTALKSLVELMMTRDMDARPGAKELLKQSRWLKKYHPDMTEQACCSIS